MGKKTRISSIMVFTLLLFSQMSNAQDEILFRRHLVNSGINGFFYGLAIDALADLTGGPAAGVAIVSSGTAVIIPLLTNSTRTITSNSMVLSAHGKFVGWAHGIALATLVGGENVIDGDNYKAAIAMGALTSISLGIVGNSLGRTNTWSEGQVALYRHYGWSIPLAGVTLTGAFTDKPRMVAASDLIFGFSSYFLADKVYKNYQFSRGDVRAIQVLTILNGGLGFGISFDKADRGISSRSDLLFPSLGVLSGTLIGQAWLKNANLSRTQGLQTAYATTGGAVIGFGLALITGSEYITPYYVIPYLTGLGAYAIAVESMRKKNISQPSLGDNHKNNWNIAFMPQNIYLNSRIKQQVLRQNGRSSGFLPCMAASLTF
jgi:hypothetical protein